MSELRATIGEYLLDQADAKQTLGGGAGGAGGPLPSAEMVLENRTRAGAALEPDGSPCDSSYELVMIALTLPLWSFATLYLVLLLVHYLRRQQYHFVYDKCTWRNAHFRYDFHLIIGRHSSNYARHESYAILDLLDSQLVSSLSVQIPGTTMFNEQQVFVYRHTRDDLRCVSFTIYRRHPIKDVKSIRIAHTCNNPDARLYMYGLEMHDHTNSESRFFPIQSVVKYRATQWALVTTFEPKGDVNFQRLGVACNDPFGYRLWPTYLEVLTLLLYVWCAAYCFGHLMSVREIFGNVPLHTITVFFITASSAAALSFVYLRCIKIHIVDNHYESNWWLAAQVLFLLLVIAVSICFWSLALNESKRCQSDSIQWLASTGMCSTFLTFLIVSTWCLADCRKRIADRRQKAETDGQLMKTNSKENLMFANDPKAGLCSALLTRQSNATNAHSSGRDAPARNLTALGPQSDSQKNRPAPPVPPKRAKSHDRGATAKQQETHAKEADETLDTAFGVGSKYIKARNRNSISQYV